jgi:alpha-glucosidase
MLALYRTLTRVRRDLFTADAPLRWLPTPEGVLAFRRGVGVCVVNLSDEDLTLPASLPVGRRVISTWAAGDDAELPANSASWFQLAPTDTTTGRKD